jgi:hypothetical protein
MTALPVAHSQLRPAVSNCCHRCVHLGPCDGIRVFDQLFNCVQERCCGGKPTCQFVCPRQPDFARDVGEVKGLRFLNLPKIGQKHVEIPLYVPHLNHRYSRDFPFDWPIVSVTPYSLLRSKSGVYTALASNPAELRSHFQILPKTRVILRGTEKDKPLERYWTHRRYDKAPEQLARLGIDLVIAPNFTHLADVPKTHNLFNRKRRLICMEELQTAGLNVAPHLSDGDDGDWMFWRGYLADQPAITQVAKEFQTGNKPLEIGLAALRQMEAIQQHLGRPLHPILIGGSRLTEHAAEMFEHFTILDSRPFMGAIKRQSFRSQGRKATWFSDPTLPNFGIDKLMYDNIDRYGLWLALRAKSKATLAHLRHRRTS